MMTNRWKWRATGYYGDKAQHPRVPGAMALQTVHADDHGKDLEVSVFKGREDIGEIVVEKIE